MTIRQQLHRIEILLNKLDAAVVVRDPGNARAAEQYEGLRKQLGLAAKNHRVHVSHLLSISDSIHKGASIDLIRDRVDDFLAELGVERITKAANPDLFEIVETIEGESDGFEILEPAVVEEMEGGALNCIRLGKARKVVARESVSASDEMPDEDRQPVTPESPQVVEPTPLRLIQRSTPLALALSAALLITGFLFGRFVFDGSGSSNTPPAPTTTVAVDSSQ